MNIDPDLCVKPGFDIVILTDVQKTGTMVGLMDCPNEVLFMIANLLGPKDIISLFQSSRALGVIFTPIRSFLAVKEKDRILVWAAHKNQLTMVKFLLENGASTSYREPERNHTALEYAAMGGYKSIVELLLENGADTHLDPKNTKSRPLNLAAFGGHGPIVNLMLRRGIDVSPPGWSQGDTTLHWAVLGGNTSVVIMVLNYLQGRAIDASGRRGARPIHYAAASGNETVLRLLCLKGARIEPNDYSDRGLLHYSAAAKSIFSEQVESEDISDFNCPWIADRMERMHEPEPVTRYILRLGININASCSRSRTPLMQATEFGNETVVRLLLAKGADHSLKEHYSETALHMAALHGEDAILNRLLEAGADINAVNSQNNIPIQEAANAGRLSIVQKLMKLHKGAEMSPFGGWISGGVGGKALMAATAGSRNGMVAFLLDQGADVNSKNESGSTGLHQAIDANAVGLTKLFLKRGADTTVRNAEGLTPLHLAAKVSLPLKFERVAYGEVGHLMVDNCPDLDAKDEYGRTALHLASLAGRQLLVRSLVVKGANITIRDHNGWSALYWAAISSNLAVVQILLDAGSNTNVLTRAGKTILHEMANRGRRTYVNSASIWQNAWQIPCPEGQPTIQWKDIVQLLINNDINLSIKDANGNTAANIAHLRLWGVMVNNLRLTKA